MVYLKPIDGGPGGVELEAGRSETGAYQAPASWSPDGTGLAIVRLDPETQMDIWIAGRDGEAELLLHTRFIAPDGRWLLFSAPSGRAWRI